MLKNFEKYLRCILLCLLLNGCASYSERFEAFYHSVFGAPETIQVQKGDTLYSIAKRYDMTMEELIELNGISSPNNLKVGQILKTSSDKYYTVKRGDTLSSIARRYHTNEKILAAQNNLSAPYILKIGQKIMVSNAVGKQSSSSNSSWKTPSNRKTTNNQTTTSVISSRRFQKFIWPVSGKVISNFGTLGKGRKNEGINISVAKGTPVKAADTGTIAYAGNGLKGFGNLILIKHNDGYITAYAHTDQIIVKKGQKVQRGEKIATVGQTGGVSTPQLHFEVRKGKTAVNPRNYLP